MKKLWGSAAMIAATVLWGLAFSAQSSGMKFVDPMLFTAIRSVTGVFALVIVIILLDLAVLKKVSLWGTAKDKAAKKELLSGGFWCGLVITAASICQQTGLKYTSAGKTGFLTALYIIIVPVLGIFLKRKTNPVLWAAVVLGLAGSYLLCGGIGAVGKGEIFVIVCALIYSIHILVIDRYAPVCDCVRLSCIQFAVASILAAAASRVAGEPWIWQKIVDAAPFWLFCGIGSSAIAFTLQMVSQKYLHPVTATLLMSLESVFAVLGGWLFLNEKLSPSELAGCSIIFAAVLLAQIPVRKKPQEKLVTSDNAND